MIGSCRTPAVLIFGRTLVDGPSDLAAVNALQDQYRLLRRSPYGKKGAVFAESLDVRKPFDVTRALTRAAGWPRDRRCSSPRVL